MHDNTDYAYFIWRATMEEDYSMMIYDSTNNRYLVLFVRFFLELCGYSVLEDWDGDRVSNEKCCFSRVVLREATGVKASSDGAYQVSVQNGKIDLTDLCEKLSDNSEDLEILKRIQSLYEDNLFRELYTITDLYASRKIDYGKEERLRRAVDFVMDKCKKWKSSMQWEPPAWRELYAYLYLVNKANEGFYKLRDYPYRLYHRLEAEIGLLKSLQLSNEVLLLEADIMRNTGRGRGICLNAYARIGSVNSLCVQYRAQYALGELKLDQAEEEYRKIYQYQDKHCRMEVKLQEPAMAHFSRCLNLKTDAFQPLFKKEVFMEKRGLSGEGDMKKALKCAEELVSSVRKIPATERTSLEFEYLYKAFIRKENVYWHLGEYSSALRECNEAESVWSDCQGWDLIEKIYGVDGAVEVCDFLDKKYSNRKKVINDNRNKIKEKMRTQL